MPYQAQAFTCQREGLTIRGMSFLPEGNGTGRKYPAIIFSHGFTGNYFGMEPLCRDFAERGYATFCFNFCGGGRSTDDPSWKSDGLTTEMSLMTEVRDLEAVMSAVRAMPQVDADRLILAGGSQGGFVSGLTAAKRPEEVWKLVMIFPALCIPDHARRGCMGGARYDPACPPETIQCPATVLGRFFHEEARRMDPYLELCRYKGPVLILQGTADPVVHSGYAIRAKEEYAPGQCHLQLIRGMGHGMDVRQHHSAVRSIEEFIAEREEVLHLRVIQTEREEQGEESARRFTAGFVGYCESEAFQGVTTSDGRCAWTQVGDEVTMFRVACSLKGRDAEGNGCVLDIGTRHTQEGDELYVQTDSPALKWMNRVRLSTVVEQDDGGATVRLFAPIKREC